jgi:hypothetical protein
MRLAAVLSGNDCNQGQALMGQPSLAMMMFNVDLLMLPLPSNTAES